jgi:lipoprotein-releasing system permease protein|tara:strand:+ start:931 stop:2133 length:1203 start_codon:yes stop_codon:yes gene_type:complete
MFNSFVFKIARRYFFARSSKTIVNRINRFAFIMIVISACSLLVVLSAFSGLKDFGLMYTNSFDPDFKVIPKVGKYFVLDSSAIENVSSISGTSNASLVLEEKVLLANSLNSSSIILKGVDSNHFLNQQLNDLSLVGVYDIRDKDNIFLGASIASDLDVVLSEDFSVKATVPSLNNFSLFNLSPFSSLFFEIQGIYQISGDIENKYAFTSLSSLGRLTKLPPNRFSAIELIVDDDFSKELLEDELSQLLPVDFRVLSKQELNPALYKMLNTENLAVYLIFCLVVIIAVFNLVGSITIMMVEKTSDLKILSALGARKGSFRNIFLSLGAIVSFFGSLVGCIIGSVFVLVQGSSPFVYVPGTSLPYPVVLSFQNLLIVFLTVSLIGLTASYWTTKNLDKRFLG